MDPEAAYTVDRPSRRNGMICPSWWSTPTVHPTLHDVLNRRTRAPVDLFSFYLWMRDQQRAVDYLDFWLDVTQHMTLCRAYVRHLRRSVLADTPEAERISKRSSGVPTSGAESEYGDAGPSEKRQAIPDNRVSAMLRSERASLHSHSNSQGSVHTRSRGSTMSGMQPPRPGYLSTTSGSPGQDHSGSSSSPQNAVNRQDVRASAERILYTYLLPGSEREIILPQTIVNEITQEVEENGRDDPEVFDAAKDYVFLAMDRDAFPGFLESKAYGNLVPPSVTMRLIIGLFCLFAAVWTGFVLIFLNYSRLTRCWVSSLPVRTLLIV
jgi:Regulator of G protein signaling domain